MATWQLRVLGEVCLEGEGKRFSLERKTAALLAYLALEGATSRTKLAGLLWPEVSEATARNNLSQALRRLRKHTGVVPVVPEDPLRLGELEVDAARLKLLVFAGESARLLNYPATLLPHLDYDDLHDFADWLYAQREELLGLHREALLAELARREREGDYGRALGHAERLLRLDPVSEEAQRQLMRLHYLAGDRAAALAAFARCRETLRRELGVEPLPETLRLADEIAAGGLLPKPVALARRPIPLAIQRPPVLAGREEDWEKLEEAWEAGKFIFIAGEAGVGKTRLAHDFAASKGAYMRFSGRPGDAAVPYAANARAWRQILATRPEVTLEPWVRLELSRLLPELEAGGRPPPLASEADKLRFFDAQGELLLLGLQGLAAAIVDDLQFYDPASSEVAVYLTGKYAPFGRPGGLPRFIDCYRSFELAAEAASYVERLVEAGTAALIELKPLGERAVSVLVDGFKLPKLVGLAKALSRFTGGNPLFIAETVKSLYEAGKLGADGPAPSLAPLPQSGRVSSLIRARLERLSPQAGRLLWSAAVADEDFDLELAAHLLDTTPLELSESWRELETRHILSGGRFSHDLLYETALASIPAPVKALLHRRCAAQLEARGATPARIARHYVDAGESAKAALFLIRAARAAEATLRFADAAEFYERVGAILETQGTVLDPAEGDVETAHDAYMGQAEMLLYFDNGPRHQAVLEKLKSLARTPEEWARSYHIETELLRSLGKGAEGEEAARIGYEWALKTERLKLRSNLLNGLAGALYIQGRVGEAVAPLQASLELLKDSGDVEGVARGQVNLALFLSHLDRQQEAVGLYREAAEALEKLGLRHLQAHALVGLAAAQAELGLVARSLEVLTGAQAMLAGLQGVLRQQIDCAYTSGWLRLHLAEYKGALAHLQEAARLASAYDPSKRCLAHVELALVFLTLGRTDRAEALLNAASHRDLRARDLARLLIARGQLSLRPGAAACAGFDEAEALLANAGSKLLLGKLWTAKAAAVPPREGLKLARQALEFARAAKLEGLRIAAETRCAQLLLSQGDPTRACLHTRSAMNLLEAHHPVDFYLGEVLLTHYQVLAALDLPTAPDQLQACLSWALGVADHNVPSEHREDFLTQNPVNHAILEAARASGLAALP